LNRLYLNNTDISGYIDTTLPGSDWDSIDIQLDDLTGLDSAEVSQLLIDLDTGDGTVASNGTLDLSGVGVTYADLSSAGQTAHDSLVNDHGWTLTLDS